MAEATALGKPVIASGYSGNLEFMSDANSYLVPYDLVEVPSSWWHMRRAQPGPSRTSMRRPLS